MSKASAQRPSRSFYCGLLTPGHQRGHSGDFFYSEYIGMSKKLGAEITCPKCEFKHPVELYRSIWVEQPENRALILNDQINAVTCPRCKLHHRLEFPFLCTNVNRGFALWYEPYHDPQVDKDVIDYRRHFGPDSFYAKAPRISNWDLFKKKLIEMEGSPLQQGTATIPSSEMQKHMSGFVTYLEQRQQQKDSFFNRVKKLILNRPQEVIDVLAALDEVHSKFKTDDIYGSIAADKVFSKARHIVAKDKESTIHSVSVEKWKPFDLALLIVSKVSGNILSSGQCHIYRGTLSGEGYGHLAIFRRAVQELAKSGFITEQEAEQDVIQIQKNIKEVG